jgi:uncharacterized protein YkwD
MFSSLLLVGLVWATGTAAPLSPVSFSAVPTRPAAVHAVAAETASPVVEKVAGEKVAEEEAFVALINAERNQRGLSTLTLDPMLTVTARAHSQEMCSQNYFDHQSPTPGLTSPMDRYLSALKQLGQSQPQYLLVGENIYYCSAFNDIYNVDYAHCAFMASPGHRANILEPRFAKVGVGIYRNAKGEFWVTEMFSRDRTP